MCFISSYKQQRAKQSNFTFLVVVASLLVCFVFHDGFASYSCLGAFRARTSIAQEEDEDEEEEEEQQATAADEY